MLPHLIVPTTICCVGCPSRASPTHCVSGPYASAAFLSSTFSNCCSPSHTCPGGNGREAGKRIGRDANSGRVQSCRLLIYRLKPKFPFQTPNERVLVASQSRQVEERTYIEIHAASGLYGIIGRP